MAGGSGDFSDFKNFWYSDEKQSENDIKKITDTIAGKNGIFDKILNDIVSQAFTESVLKTLEQTKIDNELTNDLLKTINRKLKITNKKFVILNDKSEVEKEITSPGQLGLAIFQIFNDVIELHDLKKQSEKDVKESENEEMSEALKHFEKMFFKNTQLPRTRFI